MTFLGGKRKNAASVRQGVISYVMANQHQVAKNVFGPPVIFKLLTQVGNIGVLQFSASSDFLS